MKLFFKTFSLVQKSTNGVFIIKSEGQYKIVKAGGIENNTIMKRSNFGYLKEENF